MPEIFEEFEDWDFKDANGICRCHECQMYYNTDVQRPIIKVNPDDYDKAIQYYNHVTVQQSMLKHKKTPGSNNPLLCGVEYAEGPDYPLVVIHYKYPNSQMKYELMINRDTWLAHRIHITGLN